MPPVGCGANISVSSRPGRSRTITLLIDGEREAGKEITPLSDPSGETADSSHSLDLFSAVCPALGIMSCDARG